MLKLTVCIVVLAAASCQQELLKCRRINEDEKPGISHVDTIRSIKDQLNSLAQKVEALNHSKNSLSQEVKLVLKNQIKENSLLITKLSEGVYFSLNGYRYRLTPSLMTWQQSREFCQKWGGDLAVQGVKTLTNRIKLIHNLAINHYFWIGASDIASEDHWIWVNGERANRAQLIWHRGEPNNYAGIDDCAFVAGRLQVNFGQSAGLGLAWDAPCSWAHQGLCEKRL